MSVISTLFVRFILTVSGSDVTSGLGQTQVAAAADGAAGQIKSKLRR